MQLHREEKEEGDRGDQDKKRGNRLAVNRCGQLSNCIRAQIARDGHPVFALVDHVRPGAAVAGDADLLVKQQGMQGLVVFGGTWFVKVVLRITIDFKIAAGNEFIQPDVRKRGIGKCARHCAGDRVPVNFGGTGGDGFGAGVPRACVLFLVPSLFNLG